MFWHVHVFLRAREDAANAAATSPQVLYEGSLGVIRMRRRLMKHH